MKKISRMTRVHSMFSRLLLCLRKRKSWKRHMSNPNRDNVGFKKQVSKDFETHWDVGLYTLKSYLLDRPDEDNGLFGTLALLGRSTIHRCIVRGKGAYRASYILRFSSIRKTIRVIGKREATELFAKFVAVQRKAVLMAGNELFLCENRPHVAKEGRSMRFESPSEVLNSSWGEIPEE